MLNGYQIHMFFVFQVPLTSMLEQYNTLRKEKEQDRQRQRVRALRVTWFIKPINLFNTLPSCLVFLLLLINMSIIYLTLGSEKAS